MFSLLRGSARLGALALIAGVVLPYGGARAQTKASPLNDPTILAIFDAANTYDIATGALAEKRASSKDAHEFGEMLQRDHRAVRQQGRDLAKSLGVTPTPPADFPRARIRHSYCEAGTTTRTSLPRRSPHRRRFG